MARKKDRAQYYMFGAILFIVSVFVIYISNSGLVVQEIESLDKYMSNYIYEGLNVINYAIYYKSNASEAMRNYTQHFLSFAESENLDLGLVFLFSRNGKIYADNFMEEPVRIENDGEISYAEEVEVDFNNEIGIIYNNETYYYSFAFPEKTELKVLMVETK